MNHLRPPKQRRSRRTLQKFLEATRELLEEKNFDDITVAEITQKAGASVGAFYARFDDKEGVLEYLRGLFDAEVTGDVRRTLDAKNWDNAPLEVVVRELLQVLVKSHRHHRGTLRALVLRALGSGPAVEPSREMPEALSPAKPLVDQILKRRGRINHPDPDVAVHLGLVMAASAVRERVLYPELGAGTRPRTPITDAVLSKNSHVFFLHFSVQVQTINSWATGGPPQ